MPTQDDLGDATLQPGCDALEDGVVMQGTPGDRAPGFRNNVIFRVVLPKFCLLEPWVELHLVHNRQDAGFIEQLLKLFSVEIAHPDGFRQAFVSQLDQGFPGLHKLALLWHRPVNQVKVDIIQTEALETALEGGACQPVCVHVVPQLGGYKEFFARNATLPDATTYACFVTVC